MDESASPVHVSERKSLLKAALLLQRLGSHARAIESLQKLITAEPYNLEALRAIAQSWHVTGDYANARMALERLRTSVPDDMSICVEIAETYTKANDHRNAYRYIKSALDIDPNSIVANQAMVQTLQHLGRRGDALEHRQRSGSAMAIATANVTQFETLEEPVRVLVLAHGDASHAMLTRSLRRQDMTLSILQIETLSVNAQLPEHDVLFSMLFFDASCRTTLRYLEELLAVRQQPVINRPASVLATDPAILPWRLAPIEGLRVAASVRFERQVLESPQCEADLRSRDIGLPLLIKSVNARYTRRERISSLDDLHAFLGGTEAPQFDCSPFFDLRSVDGRIRCYRIALIEAALYPLAFASGYYWRVDLTTTDAPPQSTQAEEDHFFFNIEEAVGTRAIEMLRFVARCIEIDVCVIDFSLDEKGNLALLRVDASSDWADPPEGAAFDVRRRASDRARQAIFTLILERAEKKTSLIP